MLDNASHAMALPRRLKLFAIALACCFAGAALAQRAVIPFPDPPKAKPEPEVAPRALQPAAKTPAGRTKFATQLAASFRTAGYSLEVAAQEAGSEEARHYPKLTIAGVFDEPFVFKMISAWRFREPALQSGFRSVDIVSRLGQRHYVYDMSSGIVPKCDTQQRICD